MKEKLFRGHNALIAIALAVVGVTTYGCSMSAREKDGRAEVDRNTHAEKISRFGHSYIFLQYSGVIGATFLHDPDCPCQKGGAR